MKKLTIAFLFLTAFSACQRKEELSEAMIKSRVDSLVNIRMKDINEWAKEDLEQRMAIELRSRTDSIIQSRQVVDSSVRPVEEP